MSEIISFYSVAPSQGRRTLSMALAELIAKQGFKTLYVELDVYHPAIAITNQISNAMRNAVEYFQNTITAKDFSVENYVINKDILVQTDNRELKKIFADLPEKLDFLTFPSDFSENSFPVIVDSNDNNAENKAHEYIQKMIYSFRTSNYEYVILNLPNEINNVFGFEVIESSDKILNVVTPSATRLYENDAAISFLKSNIPTFESNLLTIINQASPHLDVQTFKDLVNTNSEILVIPYDPERQEHELALENGSPVINEHIERLALMLKIDIEPTPIKKGFFKNRSK